MKRISKYAMQTLFLFCLIKNGHSQAFSWGYGNKNHTKTIDVFAIATKTNPERCGDCDGLTWKGFSADYEIYSTRLSVQYSMGMVSMAQLYSGVGPEINISKPEEIGIKTRAILGLMFFPISIGFTPTLNLKDGKPGVRFDFGWGIGMIQPILGNPIIWKK